MKEQGLIIFQDGTMLTYGEHYCSDDPNYPQKPGHEENFIKQIIPSFPFKLAGLEYDMNENVYVNAIRLSLDGLVLIFNNQLTTTSPTEILAYVPIYPTEEQIKSVEEYEKLKNIEIQKVYEFQSLDYEDYNEYNDLKDYSNSKRRNKK